MSLSIGLGRLTSGVTLPRLPEIKIRISNPFALKTPSTSQSQSSSTSQAKSLKERIEEYLSNKDVEESFFIDNGILKSAPKNRVSHQKKNQKLYGPARKQLKYLHHLNRCPSCGHYKRAHTVCMHCVFEVQRLWKKVLPKKQDAPVIEQELSEVDRKILYPGKKETEYQKRLKKKDYIEKRPRTLPVERK